MAKRRIFSVNYAIPNDDIEYLSLNSDRSLLDADIIVFSPGCPFYTFREFKGKPWLDETNSFRYTDLIKHWQHELFTAYNEGKSIFVFLSKPLEHYVNSGKQEYSGTGRNRQTTEILNSINTYNALPTKFSALTAKRGDSIRITEAARFLATYWNEFSALSSYEAYFEGEFSQVLFTSKNGSKVVGAVIQGKGSLLLLPMLDLLQEQEFDETDEENKGGEDLENEEADTDDWSKEQRARGNRLIYHLIEIDKYLRAKSEQTPAPAWVSETQYILKSETELRSSIEQLNEEIQILLSKKGTLEQGLAEEGGLRRLLFAQGKGLETAILDALRLLGFQAERFEEGDLEFDSVFVSPEGRFLGEAEGKDNKAINIDKLSQLERNLQDDYSREEVEDYAKGVLFANAYRLIPPHERDDYFTPKCRKGAERLNIALVKTPELFQVAQYLKANDDPAYAQACRVAIKQAEGTEVLFPSLPTLSA